MTFVYYCSSRTISLRPTVLVDRGWIPIEMKSQLERQAQRNELTNQPGNSSSGPRSGEHANDREDTGANVSLTGYAITGSGKVGRCNSHAGILGARAWVFPVHSHYLSSSYSHLNIHTYECTRTHACHSATASHQHMMHLVINGSQEMFWRLLNALAPLLC